MSARELTSGARVRRMRAAPSPAALASRPTHRRKGREPGRPYSSPARETSGLSELPKEVAGGTHEPVGLLEMLLPRDRGAELVLAGLRRGGAGVHGAVDGAAVATC